MENLRTITAKVSTNKQSYRYRGEYRNADPCTMVFNRRVWVLTIERRGKPDYLTAGQHENSTELPFSQGFNGAHAGIMNLYQKRIDYSFQASVKKRWLQRYSNGYNITITALKTQESTQTVPPNLLRWLWLLGEYCLIQRLVFWWSLQSIDDNYPTDRP